MANSINSFLPTSKTSGCVTLWYDAVLVLFLNLFWNLSDTMTLVHALFIGKDSIVPNLTPVKGQKMMTLKGNYNPIRIALVFLLLTSRVQAQVSFI
jgi:predicted CDP-diglyceride synthetase/phosphatidate cytidylyltransferase